MDNMRLISSKYFNLLTALVFIKLKLFLLSFKSTCFLLNQKDSGEDDDEGKEPSWEKQEAMVRKLQKKFPDQDKEVKTHTYFLSVTLEPFHIHFSSVRFCCHKLCVYYA